MTFISFHLLALDGMLPAASDSCCPESPSMVDSTLKARTQINHPLSYLSQALCHSDEKSNQDKQKHCQMLRRYLGASPSVTWLLAHWALVLVVVVLPLL